MNVDIRTVPAHNAVVPVGPNKMIATASIVMPPSLEYVLSRSLCGGQTLLHRHDLRRWGKPGRAHAKTASSHTRARSSKLYEYPAQYLDSCRATTTITPSL